MFPRMIMALILACWLFVACDTSKKPLSGSWGTGEEQITFHKDFSVDGLVRVRISERYEALPPGQTYVEEVDGKPVSGWKILGGEKPCMVTIITEGGAVELSSEIASISPDVTFIEKVKDRSTNKQFLGTAGCDYYEKIPIKFGQGALGFTFGRPDASAENTTGGIIYRKRTSGLLRFRGNYIFTHEGIEIHVPTVSAMGTREHLLLRCRLSGNKITVLGNEGYIMKDILFEKRTS